jgi:hypothetical protein
LFSLAFEPSFSSSLPVCAAANFATNEIVK